MLRPSAATYRSGVGEPAGGRLIIVSNRLPVSICRDGGRLTLCDSPGGLANGLRGVHERGDGLWIGWPGGETRTERRDSELAQRLAHDRLVPIPLSAKEAREYYDRFSNSVLWPLFHYLLERVPLDGHGWGTYRTVNERYADVAAAEYRPGDIVWIHDYQLMLVPGLLRERVPDCQIGFFLHIPFPSSELFRVLPWRRELLEGVLGADLIGFHTHGYVRHFVAALQYILGLEPGADAASYLGREVRLGSFPMGIDAEAFECLAASESVRRRRDAIRQECGGRRFTGGPQRS